MNLILSFVWTILSFILLIQIQSLFRKYLFGFSQLLTNRTKLAKIIYSILFFPGVMVHEMSHFFSASFLGIKTGDIEIFPREINGKLELGSVKVAKTDIFRRTIIGTSPLVIGISSLFLILKINFPFTFSISESKIIPNIFLNVLNLQKLVLLYFLFAISNTMVLSENDKKGLIPTVLFTISLILIILLVLPLSSLNTILIVNFLVTVLNPLAITFSTTFLINLFFLIPILISVKLLEKIKKSKLQFKKQE